MTRLRAIDTAFLLAALAFAIASAVHAEPVADGAAGEAVPTVVIPEDIVHSVITGFVRDEIDREGSIDPATRLEIDVRWQGDLLLENPGVVDYQVRKLSSRPFRGPAVTRLDVIVDGQVERTMAITVDCRLYQDVVVTNRVMRRGELLTDDALEIEERDVTSLKHGVFDRIEALETMQAARPIGAGDVITRRHAEPIPVIHRGDQIVMQVVSSNMAVEAVGVAMQDGGVGEQIRVKNNDSGKVVRGQILEAGLVQVRGL